MPEREIDAPKRLIDVSKGLLDAPERLIDVSKGLLDASQGLLCVSEPILGVSESLLDMSETRRTRRYELRGIPCASTRALRLPRDRAATLRRASESSSARSQVLRRLPKRLRRWAVFRWRQPESSRGAHMRLRG